MADYVELDMPVCQFCDEEMTYGIGSNDTRISCQNQFCPHLNKWGYGHSIEEPKHFKIKRR
jgi:hypothetical protein